MCSQFGAWEKPWETLLARLLLLGIVKCTQALHVLNSSSCCPGKHLFLLSHWGTEHLVMHTFQTCILRKQSAGLPGLVPDVSVAHATARTGGRLTAWMLWAGFFLSSEVEVQALCVYTACSRNSVWTNVWVSALLSHNRLTGVGGRVNWCKQQLCSLSCHTWVVVWSVRKLVWILSVELWWVLDYSLSPDAHYFAKKVALQSERITHFHFYLCSLLGIGLHWFWLIWVV